MSDTYNSIIAMLDADPSVKCDKRDVSHSPETEQEYDRVIYHDAQEDLWFNIERPRAK